MPHNLRSRARAKASRPQTISAAVGAAALIATAVPALALAGSGKLPTPIHTPLERPRTFALRRVSPQLAGARGRVRITISLRANPVAAKASSPALRGALTDALSDAELRLLRRKAQGGGALARRHEASRKLALRRLQPAADRAAREQLRIYRRVRALGGRVVNHDLIGNTVSAVVPARTIRQLAARSDVGSIEPAISLRPDTLSDSTGSTGAPTWWGAGYTGGTGSNDVNPVDVDLGPDEANETHPVFAGQTFENYPGDSNEPDCTVSYNSACGHGTGTASVLASRGASSCSLCQPSDASQKGVAPAVDKILVAGAGAWELGIRDPNFGVDGAVDPAEINSISYGSPATVDDTAGLQANDDAASEYGLLEVYPAGNDGPTGTVDSPCIGYDTLCVGAIDIGSSFNDPSDDTLDSYSSVGPTPGGRKKPDLVAPGDVTVADARYVADNDLWTGGTGTSFAAPAVAGAAALLEGAGIPPLATRAILIDSAQPGRATSGSAMGTQTTWQSDWGWGELSLSNAYSQRGNFDSSQVAGGDVRFYRANVTAAGDRATLTWNRRATGCMYSGCTTAAQTLTNLDLEQLDATTHAVESQSTSTLDNVEQVRSSSAAGQVLYEVKAVSSVDGLSTEPYAIAATRQLTPLVTPRPTTELSVGADTAKAGDDVAVSATITNPSPALAADGAQVTLQIPAGVQLVSGAATQGPGGGTLAPSGSFQANWTVQGSADGLKQLVAQTQATAVDTTVSSSDTRTLTVDGTPPTVTLSAPEGSSNDPNIGVGWNGTDNVSGVRNYDIDVSVDGGPFNPWLTATTPGSTTYPGAAGHSYAFGARASDNAGNTSGFTYTAPVTITAQAPPPGPLPGPFPPPRTSAHLKVTSVKRKSSTLLVAGTIARGASPVALSYSVKLGHKRLLLLRRTIRPRSSGLFSATLKLPTRAMRARTGTLLARYAGNNRYLAQTVKRSVRTRH